MLAKIYLDDQWTSRSVGVRATSAWRSVLETRTTTHHLTLTFLSGSGIGSSAKFFRERGLPHELVVLTDLSRTFREEERNAWQRLVRVIGHEMNNSLAPIKSIAGSLETLIRRDPPPADWRMIASSGLNVIATRAESLSRFMQAYARLARLPPPQKEQSILVNSLGESRIWKRACRFGLFPGRTSIIRPTPRSSSNYSLTFYITGRKLLSKQRRRRDRLA